MISCIGLFLRGTSKPFSFTSRTGIQCPMVDGIFGIFGGVLIQNIMKRGMHYISLEKTGGHEPEMALDGLRMDNSMTTVSDYMWESVGFFMTIYAPSYWKIDPLPSSIWTPYFYGHGVTYECLRVGRWKISCD